jgi:hypothetical protein
VAAQLKRDLGVDTDLIVGNPGEFTVWFGDRKLAEKSAGRFPEADAIVGAVRSATS